MPALRSLAPCAIDPPDRIRTIRRFRTAAALAALAFCAGCAEVGEPPLATARPAPGADIGAARAAATLPAITLASTAATIDETRRPNSPSAAEATASASQPGAGRPLAEWLSEAGSGVLLLNAGGGHFLPSPTLATEIDVSVSGVIARGVVRQRFQNSGDTWGEGIYVFPLPDDAAVDHMRIVSDGRIIEGQVQERERARRTYEKARSQGKQASLVEQERPNVFTTSVANIPPHSEVSVEIEYQQTVQLDSGQFSLRIPTVVGPRFIPGQPTSETQPYQLGQVLYDWADDTDAVPDAHRITPPVHLDPGSPINPLHLRIDLEAGFELDAVVSPYHAVAVTPNARGTGFRVELEPGSVADRDFVLEWKPRPGASPQAFVFTEQHGASTYALLMVTPPDGHSARTNEPPPREVVYVIDTSGSMGGASIVQAKQALEYALQKLRPGDLFNVIEFNDAPHAMFPRPVPADPRNVGRAVQGVARLEANGGTAIGPALTLALDSLGQQRASAAHLSQVVFLTDGSVGNEAQLFEMLKRKVDETRVFTIGIGSAPNSYFMRKLARLGRGSFTHIGDPNEVTAKMKTLFRKLDSVLFADIEVDTPRGLDVEAHPRRVPDLYAGEPLVMVMKLNGPLDWASVRGSAGDRFWQVDLGEIDQPDANRPGIHVLWARRAIAELMDDRLGLHDEKALDALRDDVVAMAIEHHLVSAYTSLVAVDVTPIRPADATLDTHELATHLPAGWQAGAVFGLAQGATPAPLLTVFGIISVLGAALCRGAAGSLQ